MGDNQYIHGPFHRVRSSTQTDEVCRMIIMSGELWGKTPYGGDKPQVQAYRGRLPVGVAGIEFMTAIGPFPNNHPYEVRWRPEQPGVRSENGFAKIDILIVRDNQLKMRN
jgi:hypothetical protein